MWAGVISEIKLRNFLNTRSPEVKTSKCLHAWDFSFSFLAALVIFMVHRVLLFMLLKYHNPNAHSLPALFQSLFVLQEPPVEDWTSLSLLIYKH